nr:gamma-tubulin complex component 6-like isoform X1 [Onthophagus taurus]
MKFIMDNHSCSVYELITKLCERMLISSGKKPNKENIKKLRAISYEILLSKKISRYVGLNLLEDNKDPICNLLAWQLMLVYRYKLPEHAKKIQNNLDVLEKSGAIKDDVVKSVLFFLIQLRNPPEIESGISSLSLLSGESCIKYRIFSKHSFHLNLPPICSNAKYNNSSFYFNPPPSKCCDKRNFNCEACMRSQIRSSSCSLFKDLEKNDEVDQIGEEDSIKSKFEDPTEIWELVSKTVYTKHRTWESLGNPCPEKEKDFLTDSSLEVINLFHEFIRGKEAKLKLNFDSIGANKVVKRESFIKHLRLLLVGTSSDSFDLNENNEMFLIKNVTIDGVSREALEDYSKDLIFCGTFYRVLNNFCQMDMKGFVLKAFCNSLQEYLSFYRVATFTISEKMGLLCVSNHMKPLYEHLKNLISICRIDRSKNGGLPSAVDLLNDLYERLSDFPVKEIGMLLCSSFSTCVQVYFGRFLQQWIFDGILNDPHDEFFIANSRKSLKPISRSYWTKCFVIKEEKVPDFLIDLAKDVLYCGKVMNLLKICAPKNPLCINLVAQKRALLRCCLSWGEISELEENVICYKYESILKCGSKFSIKEYLLKIEEDDAIIADLVVKKRAEAIKRLEMEKLEVANRLLEEKRRNVAILKADYDKALLDKKEAITRGMLKELEVKRANLKLYCLRKQVVEEEAKKLVNYYDKLMEESDRKLLDIQRHLNRGKMIEIKPQESFYSTVEIKSDSNSDSSFHSAISNDFDENNPNEGEGKKIELTPLKLTQNVVKENNKSICSELDSINANLINNEVENELIKMVRENKEAALKNKMRVMSDEMGFIWNNNNNKDCCGEPKIESNLNVVNENFKKIDENVLNNNNNTKEISLIKNDRNLTLNLTQNDSKTIFSQFWKSPNFEFPKPMSIDSTPSTSICSKSTIEFQFNPTPTSPDLNNLEKQIEKSVSIPLKAQINLIDNELLRHFFVNLKYLDHLKLFRSYFFLLDGEFSRNITEELFNKLYKGKDSKPTDLLNVSTLQNLIRHALDSSIKSKGEFASILSFKINNIPKNFDLNDPDVLSCLSLSYEVKWPLNVLLPKDIVAKYDEVFKFLLKLNMVSWVLKEMFQLMEESDRKLLNIQKHLNRTETIEIKPQ